MKMRFLTFLLVFALSFCAFACKDTADNPPQTPPQPQSTLSPEQIYETNVSYVAEVQCGNEVGSGVVISSDGTQAIVLTCYHIAENFGGIRVKFYGANDYVEDVEFVAYDELFDVAFLRVNTTMFPSFQVNGATQLEKVGATTYAIGNALGEELTFTSGIMSVQEQIVKISDLTYTTLFFRATTPFTKGMSGGGIYNKDAQLIGMVCARHTQSYEINYGLSYSIINALYSRLDEAKTNRLIPHASIEFSKNTISVDGKTFVKNSDGVICSSDTAITAINAVPLTDIKSFTQMCSIILQTPSVSFA